MAAAPIIPACLTALNTYHDTRFRTGHADWDQILFTFVYWISLGGLTPFVYLLANRYPIRRQRLLSALLAHSAGALILGVAWGVLGLLLREVRHRMPLEGAGLITSLRWILNTLPYSVVMYVLMLAGVYAFMYYSEAREREAQQARLAAQLAEARLNALRAQLNPHFLFNSLNAITVLVRDRNVDDASRMLELLSEVLRQVLQQKSSPQTTLGEELEFLKNYLAIEQVRFSDSLEVHWSVEPTTLDILVPEFILQPLVENALRHGIARNTAVGILEIAATESNGEIVLTVQDNGPGYQTSAGEGLGLTNTRERLNTLYGKAGQLVLMPAKASGTIAEVRFPARRQVDE